MKPKILIIDDHETVREGIRRLLTPDRTDWEICRKATNGKKAIEAAKSLRPDVIFLDITMMGMSGVEAAPQILKLNGGCRILVFTMHDSDRLSPEIRGVGAHGYVQKSQAVRDLVVAVERLLEDSAVLFCCSLGSDPAGKNVAASSNTVPRFSAIRFMIIPYASSRSVETLARGNEGLALPTDGLCLGHRVRVTDIAKEA